MYNLSIFSLAKGTHVDHTVEMQLVAKAATLKHPKTKKNFYFIKKTFNDTPNLQLLNGKLNIQKGNAWKNGKATKDMAKNALVGLKNVMQDPNVLYEYKKNAWFKGFIRQLEKIASKPLGSKYKKKW